MATSEIDHWWSPPSKPIIPDSPDLRRILEILKQQDDQKLPEDLQREIITMGYPIYNEPFWKWKFKIEKNNNIVNEHVSWLNLNLLDVILELIVYNADEYYILHNIQEYLISKGATPSQPIEFNVSMYKYLQTIEK